MHYTETFPILKNLASSGFSLSFDSRSFTKPEEVFFAYPGNSQDGRNWIEEVIGKGAKFIFYSSCAHWEQKLKPYSDKVQLFSVEKLEDYLGEIAAEFYNHPSKKLKVTVITGTNGKTSCANLLTQALNRLGCKAAFIGTTGAGSSNDLGIIPTDNTSPHPFLLQQLLHQFLSQGIGAVNLEGSSHGLTQGRLKGVKVDYAVFTNLSHDHLDYHKDMESYYQAKKSLFSLPLKGAVINVEDLYGARLYRELEHEKFNLIGYCRGEIKEGLLSAIRIVETTRLLNFLVSYRSSKLAFQSKLVGNFNLANLLAVIGVLLLQGYPLSQVGSVVAKLEPVTGRMQVICNYPLVIVDFAHTPDGLKQVLTSLQEQRKAQKSQGKIICVFGCGGNRDKGKRPLMGAIATDLADKVIITSDNSRDEEFSEIAQAIISGIDRSKNNYQVQADRRKATQLALCLASKEDYVLIAGKGHETYQEQSSGRTFYSDAQTVQELLEQNSSLSMTNASSLEQ